MAIVKMICLAIVAMVLLIPNQSVCAEEDYEVRRYLATLVEAYNQRDVPVLQSLIGDTSQEWIIEESTRERDEVQIQLLSLLTVASETNATVAATTISLPGGRTNTLEMVLTLGIKEGKLKLLSSRTPGVAAQNRDLIGANTAALQFADAVNASKTNAVLRWLGLQEGEMVRSSGGFAEGCRGCGLAWVSEAILNRWQIAPRGVRRHRGKIHVRFVVAHEGDEPPLEKLTLFEDNIFRGFRQE